MKYQEAFYKVTVVWEYLLSCYKVEFVQIKVTTGTNTEQETVLDDKTDFEVYNLLPGRDYVVELVIQYEGNKKSNPVTLSFTSNTHSVVEDGEGEADGQDGGK